MDALQIRTISHLVHRIPCLTNYILLMNLMYHYTIKITDQALV